jgi:phosphoserine aminotransferase
MIVLSPRAVQRLETYTPAWPLPKIFRMAKDGKLIDGIFKGETINTPSMLCVEDIIDALKWGQSIGGLAAMRARSEASLAALEAWVAKSDWAGFLCADKAIRSNTSICLKIVDPWFTALGEKDQDAAAKQVAALLEKEGVALDIGAYRDAPPGLRIWGGATVDPKDIAALTPWLDWAFAEVKASFKPAAAA